MSSKNKERNPVYESTRKAVIIGETFTKLLTPLTNDLPELLLTICGIPLIEYLIDSLTSSNVKEIILCVKNNSQVLEKYIKKNHKKNANSYSIKLISSEDFNSVGDCLRKINCDKLITSDFILIRGLVLTNIDFEAVFSYHLQNKEKDKHCIMTSLLKHYKNDKHIRTNYDENIMIYNSMTNRILQYEATFEKSKVQINENVSFQLNKEGNINSYEVRSDLYDSYMDICAVEVLNIFTENFDYQYIRDGIYKSVLVSEVYTDTFYLFEISRDYYVGLIRNTESYLKVSFEILNRWAHPMVIEDVFISPKLKINYKSSAFSIYCDKDNKEENYLKAKLLSSVVLSRQTRVGEFSELSSCIAGTSVNIGQNCYLSNCIIFPDTIIEDNVHIENSIISSQCYICKGVEIKNSIIGTKVRLDGNANDERVYQSLNIDEDQNESENIDDDSYSLTIERMEKDIFLKNLEDDEVLFLPYEEDQNEEDDNDEDDNENISEASEEEEDYKSDIELVINNGIPKGVDITDIVKEIAGLKNAFWEKTYEETLKACLIPILTLFMKQESFNHNHIEPLKNLLIDWKGLFTRMIPNPETQVNSISVLEEVCMEINEISEAFHIILQLLNSDELNVISDDAIKEWASNSESKYPTDGGDVYISQSFHTKFNEKMKKYINSNINA